METKFLLNNRKNIIIVFFVVFTLFIVFPSIYLYQNYQKNKLLSEKKYILFYYEKNNYKNASLLILNPKKNDIFIYRIRPDIYIIKEEQPIKLFKSFSIRDIQTSFKKNYGINIDSYIKINKKQTMKLIDSLGGIFFFNNSSENFKKGTITINSKNYESFLNSIKDVQMRYDQSFNLSINYLYQKFLFFQNKNKNHLTKILYNNINTNISKYLFYFMIENLYNNFSKLSFSYNKINFSSFKEHSSIKLLFKKDPYTYYDVEKINGYIHNDDATNKERIINTEIINTTDIKRLAAKKSEFLKKKKIGVKEYSNSSINIKTSIIIIRNFDFTSIQHLMEITNIKYIYYIFNYKNNYDATIILGESERIRMKNQNE